jgi:NTE family protein
MDGRAQGSMLKPDAAGAEAPEAAPTEALAPPVAVKTINLALQGGGAHGAFSWGVIDRLLEDGRIAIEGISATSAGAMNAVACAYGLATGGPEAARRTLERFWMKVSDAAALSPLQPSWVDRIQANWGLEWSPSYLAFDLVTRLFSPYEFNPLNLNPLKQVLESVVDFSVLRQADAPVRLYLSATNVRTGRVKVFGREELCADAALASACLPFLFHAVEIDGEAYWDGGYMGNPAIFPLIYGCDSHDVVLVHINPMMRPDVPRTARDILNRVNEISFNSSLMREMRAIQFVTELIDGGKLNGAGMKRMFIHSIAADEVMARLGVNSKLNADRTFLRYRRDAGRRAAGEWLDANFDALGNRSSIDIPAQYL